MVVGSWAQNLANVWVLTAVCTSPLGKRAYRKTRENKELEASLCATVHTRNAFALVGGYSPHQRVFGTQIQVPGGNLSDEWREVDIAAVSAVEAGDARPNDETNAIRDMPLAICDEGVPEQTSTEIDETACF
eukprot:117735-Amphidinium_carterae.2